MSIYPTAFSAYIAEKDSAVSAKIFPALILKPGVSYHFLML